MNTTRLDQLSELADSPHAIIQKMTMKELWNLQLIPLAVSESLWDHAATCAECSVRMHEARVEQLATGPESVRLAANTFAKRLLAEGTGTVYTPSAPLRSNEHSATMGHEYKPTGGLSLPETIRDAGVRLFNVIPNLSDRLIGFSQISNAIPAAAGSITLSARLDRFRGGDVHLTLEHSGLGTLRGSFKYPDTLFVGVYDSTEQRLLEIVDSVDSNVGVSNSVTLKNTDTLPIRLRILWPEAHHKNLVLLVWSEDRRI